MTKKVQNVFSYPGICLFRDTRGGTLVNDIQYVIEHFKSFWPTVIRMNEITKSVMKIKQVASCQDYHYVLLILTVIRCLGIKYYMKLTTIAICTKSLSLLHIIIIRN